MFKKESCNIVLSDLDGLPIGASRIDYFGYVPNNGKKIRFRSDNLYFGITGLYAEIGDTMKKGLGSKSIYLYKKDSIIVLNYFPCQSDSSMSHKLISFRRPISKADSLALAKLNQE